MICARQGLVAAWLQQIWVRKMLHAYMYGEGRGFSLGSEARELEACSFLLLGSFVLSVFVNRVAGASSPWLSLVLQDNQACAAVYQSCPVGHHHNVLNADKKCKAQLCNTGAPGDHLQNEDLALCCKA